MSNRVDRICGCAYVGAGGKWYQVVACPQHVMDMAPHDEVPEPKADMHSR